MNPKIAYIFRYIKYLWMAKHKRGHGLHSPFLFNLYCEIIEPRPLYYAFVDIELIRDDMADNKSLVEIEDFGAGSVAYKNNNRRICDVYNSASLDRKYGELLFRLTHHLRAKTILELGTCLGISTLYLARTDSRAKVITIEGAKNLSSIAQKNFEKSLVKNIIAHTGEFDVVLPKVLRENPSIDVVYLDGNHRYEPTMKYFNMILPNLHNESMIVFDDIHWSPEMEKAWKEISENQSVTLSLDLFRFGIVFFKKELKKEHFILQFS